MLDFVVLLFSYYLIYFQIITPKTQFSYSFFPTTSVPPPLSSLPLLLPDVGFEKVSYKQIKLRFMIYF